MVLVLRPSSEMCLPFSKMYLLSSKTYASFSEMHKKQLSKKGEDKSPPSWIDQ